MYPSATFKGFFFSVLVALPLQFHAQAITGIITDLNGFWKTSTTAVNPIKPDNSHNLLAFTYNNIQYSTGVNDAGLAANSESFIPCDFWALPVANIGAPNSNTKVGLGAFYDGVLNGASNPAPENNLPLYLTDGIKGLNLGTCIANLPAGSLDFFASNINAASIGDGVPDIVVTQVADPSGTFDRYEFIDANGSRVGNYKDIIFTNIAPVGNWTADFYEPTQNPMILTAGFTRTDRAIRLWAADLSEFGITAANLSSVSKFRVNLSGSSDIAFVSYNKQSFNVANVLPLTLSSFKGVALQQTARLSWQTSAQAAGANFSIERSADGKTFASISIQKTTQRLADTYSYTDAYPLTGENFYRLKITDEHGVSRYSSVVRIEFSVPKEKIIFDAGTKTLFISADGIMSANLSIYSTSGLMLQKKSIQAAYYKFTINNLPAGIYIAVLETGKNKLATKFSVP